MEEPISIELVNENVEEQITLSSEESLERLDFSLEEYQPVPVTSVNGKKGKVELTTEDIPNTSNYQNKPEVDANIKSKIDEHNSSSSAHPYLQSKINASTQTINSLAAELDNKQNKITPQNKLNSDLVSDANQVNKFVTSAEKTTWNNKSNFSGDYDDLTDKPVISYIDTEINNRVVTQVTRTKTVESTHDSAYYGTYHFIPLDMSPYTSSTGSRALLPQNHLPAGRYVTTGTGYIRMGTTSYKLDPGTFVFWDGDELDLIGYNACEYWSYNDGEWEGGYFTTQVDVESMLEEAIITRVVDSGSFNVADKDNGYYLFNYSSISGTSKRVIINVEGTSTNYYPYNGTILIKNDLYVVMLGRENLIFEYDSEHSYYKSPTDLSNLQTQIDELKAEIAALRNSIQ